MSHFFLDDFIKGVLESMGIPYQREMRFADCKDVRALPFDFYLPQHTLAIEYELNIGRSRNLSSAAGRYQPTARPTTSAY